MKSLEIVNERIESTLKAEDKLKMELQLCFYKDEANCIKQDLEVLEILRKHLSIVEMSNNWIEIDLYEEDQKEEFEKLKQWLEENE